ncbi:alcohol dehydrogenase family protein [Paracoccus sp. 1_MG-2023]|uniref:alcohol dehydrogenase family protein n=1 Tax=unclassified Paracoccus (in: a-proteobacteria) TaxID=2688777 RepID=UPI001C09AAA7|nr:MULTISPECIES: alcohol dehydrogenase family protein [unclassified Paracoccus (in: a-proteobacteria)]MBU2957726.1 alcohol dehydrogenase family protein [Paracoccus sp. C2R09]MDO6667426.1 alcohol dehydrogenase family protein [Paracoccus sp. 1_MG-2023]
MTRTMKGMVLTGHGGPERMEWHEDLAVPQPAAGEVQVRVLAAAVNNTDINTRIGWYSKAVRGDTAQGAASGYDGQADADGGWDGALQFPRIQGADCCGIVTAVGEGVSPDRIGERVLLRPMFAPAGDTSDLPLATLGSERDGAFAEYTTAEARHAIRVTSDLSDVELASFPCAFSTAEGMIQRGGLGAERVLITGASGGVGSAAIQLARRRGAHVTALSSPSKADALRELGANEVLDRDAPLPDAAFDVVLDLVGGPRWGDVLAALRKGGRYVTSGAIAGPIVELDLRTLYLRDLTLIGSTFQPDSVFTDLVGYIEAGEIRPTLARTFPLRELHAAQEMFLDKRHVGKIGITVAE